MDVKFSDAMINGIRENVARYAKLGVKIHFTEMDVRCNKAGQTCNLINWKSNPWPQKNLERQAEIYSKILQVCLDEPLCESFESWGFTDRKTFLPEGQNGLPFDKDMNPKPAQIQMVETLKKASKKAKKEKKAKRNSVQFLQ